MPIFKEGTISKLREQKNGEKFSALFDYGDIAGYGSTTEADAALCALIAFRTGTDVETLDAIFRQSALYREKWEREDYWEDTIAAEKSECERGCHQLPERSPVCDHYGTVHKTIHLLLEKGWRIKQNFPGLVKMPIVQVLPVAKLEQLRYNVSR